jgi:hypothetical protein
MKILSAPDREDGNKGMRDLDDVKAFLTKGGVSMVYKTDAEKATFKAALEKFLPMYLEKETNGETTLLGTFNLKKKHV